MVTLLDTVGEGSSKLRARHPEKAHLPDTPVLAKPAWIRVRAPGARAFEATRAILRGHRLHTVCESAKCPNMGECWARGTATVMILGNVCTRSCGFCNIATGRPPELDLDEPRRVADAIALMKLRHCVITSVNRDELPDGGAKHLGRTIRRTRDASPGTTIEVLIPDFCGDWDALQTVLDAKTRHPQPQHRNRPLAIPPRPPQAKYPHSLELLRRAKAQGFFTKSGLMTGIGETDEELEGLPRPADDRAGGGVDFLTLGQYLQPTRKHAAIDRFVTPEEFVAFRDAAEAKGFLLVAASPLTRSSYHAAEDFARLKSARQAALGR